MYLNRFTISISSKSSIPIEELKPFNLVCSEIEERLFKVMPKKIKVGGYGYVSIILHDNKDKSDWVKEYGQIADCNLYSYKFNLDEFLKKGKTEQYHEILNIYEKGLMVLASHLSVDSNQIGSVINALRESS